MTTGRINQVTISHLRATERDSPSRTDTQTQPKGNPSGGFPLGPAFVTQRQFKIGLHTAREGTLGCTRTFFPSKHGQEPPCSPFSQVSGPISCSRGD